MSYVKMEVESREPPSLQDLVLVHGTWDKIPPKTWQTFNAEMAEWKAKVRYGELAEGRGRTVQRFNRSPGYQTPSNSGKPLSTGRRGS